MTTIPHARTGSGLDTGAWADVADVVDELGPQLGSAGVMTAVRKLLTARTGASVEAFAIDGEKRQLRDVESGWNCEFHPGLAAALQVETTPVETRAEWDPGHMDGGSYALGLRAGDQRVGVVFLRDCPRPEDPALPVLGALAGGALARALSLEELAASSGESDKTRRLQQQILDQVSHEFNTPLMILRSSADFAREAGEEDRELFFDMHSQALDRLEQLVRGVIDVARSTAGGKAELLSTTEIVDTLIQPHCAPADWPADPPRVWHRPSGLQVSVEADALGLVFEHLIGNARLHGAAAGAHVAIAVYESRTDEPARRLTDALVGLGGSDPHLPDPVPDPDAICVEVLDSGPGIPSDELELVFEPFTQASNSPLLGVSGAGMGLATARRLVDDTGGRLDVESVEGKGSLFRILLPAH
jgi:signal transduction histidine kinase